MHNVRRCVEPRRHAVDGLLLSTHVGRSCPQAGVAARRVVSAVDEVKTATRGPPPVRLVKTLAVGSSALEDGEEVLAERPPS